VSFEKAIRDGPLQKAIRNTTPRPIDRIVCTSASGM
jgi:hypothetical protein